MLDEYDLASCNTDQLHLIIDGLTEIQDKIDVTLDTCNSVYTALRATATVRSDDESIAPTEDSEDEYESDASDDSEVECQFVSRKAKSVKRLPLISSESDDEEDGRVEVVCETDEEGYSNDLIVSYKRRRTVPRVIEDDDM
jgi:hypothetical protein